LTVTFGGAVGLLLYYFVIGAGKVRNQNRAILFAGIAGLLASYYQWAFWLDVTLNPSAWVDPYHLISTNLNPVVMVSRLIEIHGTHEISIFNLHVRGMWASLIRIAEVGIIVGISVALALKKVQEPFSESQNSWAHKVLLPPYEYIEISWWLKSTLEDDDFTFLKSIKRATSDKKSHSIFTLYDCGEDKYYLSIINRMMSSDGNGKTKNEDDEFLKQILIDKASAEFLLAAETTQLQQSHSPQTSWNMEPI